MAIHLLDLPPELLILILYHLDLPTLVFCLAVNRCLKSIIDGSTLIQYRLAAQAAFVEDNPWNTKIDSAHKLLALQRREAAFTELVPTSICSVELDDIDLDSCKYALSGSIFAMAELDTRVLRWISLVATEPVFQRLEFAGYIQDLTFVPEEDLLVVVLSSEPLEDHASDVAVELRFYEMSTQSAHRMAREHVVHVPQALSQGAHCPDMFEIDICGPKVALVANYYGYTTRSWVLVYDWKLGCLLKSFSNYSAAVFLSPDVMLVTQKYAQTFEMWTVSDDTLAGPNISLMLPPAVERGTYEIMCVGSDPKGNGSSASQEPFHSSFADSNVGFEIDFLFRGDRDRQEKLWLVISRRALLQLLPSVEDQRGKELLWKDWGPITHWLDKNFLEPTSWKTICGQRCAFAGPSGRIRLVNFNPYAYKKAMQTEGDDPGQTAIQAGLQNAVVSPRGENRAIGIGLFGEEVRSNLGYLVAESTQETTYVEVFLGAEWIVGLKGALAPDSKQSIDIWHFG
ncbi:hypothetical protein C8F04DRAFT_1252574 [Mycena alexandri]|uniref:F-box domain-containing protein n=1 Tax=Mycena alexandri TaxID=1745969 RepID=A0AAD6T918_9AGAR|nr:hypothetical protein C8F04DRAFT_1252574 [Mycena alexandri]